MSLFKPVLVEHKTSLDSVTKVNGQYIIVVDTKEIYVDRLASDGTVERVNASRSGVFIQAEEPTNAVEGDIWFQIEQSLQSFTIGPSGSNPLSAQSMSYNFEEGMTWDDFIVSSFNVDKGQGLFMIDSGWVTLNGGLLNNPNGVGSVLSSNLIEKAHYTYWTED